MVIFVPFLRLYFPFLEGAEPPLAGDEPASYTFLVAAFLLLPTKLPLSISLVEVVIQEAAIKIIDIVEMFSPPLSALIPNPYHLLLTTHFQ